MKLNAAANPAFKNILVDCKLLRRLATSKHRITIRGKRPFVKTGNFKDQKTYLAGVLYKDFIEFDILVDGILHHQVVNFHHQEHFDNIKTIAINNVMIATRDSADQLVTTGKAWRDLHECTIGMKYKKIK